MISALGKAIENKIPILNMKWLANISEDDFCVESYDLKVGETYTVRDLAKRARDYAKKPNVSRDPRTQFKMLCLYYGILSPRDLIEAGEKQ